MERHSRIMRHRYQSRLQQGSDEQAWLAEVEELAATHGCSVESRSGYMWPRSRGRQVVIDVKDRGPESDIMAFATARLDGMDFIAEFVS